MNVTVITRNQCDQEYAEKKKKPAVIGSQLQSFLEPLEHNAQKNKISFINKTQRNLTKTFLPFRKSCISVKAPNLK